MSISIDVTVITETTTLNAAYFAAYGIGEFKNLEDNVNLSN